MRTPSPSSIDSQSSNRRPRPEKSDVQGFSIEGKLQQLIRKLVTTNEKTSNGLYSKQCLQNLQNGVERLKGEGNTTKGQAYALRCLESSVEIFVLIHAYCGTDTLNRMKKEGREKFLDAVVKWWTNSPQKHEPILSSLAEKYSIATIAADLKYPISSSQ